MSQTMYYRRLPSPIGYLLLTSDGQSLTGLHMKDLAQTDTPDPASRWIEDEGPFRTACQQLGAYFDGEATSFDLPLTLRGTSFQERVWQELCAIPFGVAISYVELARRVGNPAASRAVGGANGRNPVAIIVPCHRVIAADGGLGGYGGGLDRKRWLLEHEAEVILSHPQQRPKPFPGAITPRLGVGAPSSW